MKSDKRESLPFKLAAIDLDDTLLSSNKTISDDNLAAIERLRKAGVKVIIASGRSHQSCIAFHRQLDLSGHVISCQGGFVKDAETELVLHRGTIHEELVRRILAKGAESGATAICYCEHGVFATADNDWTLLYERVGGHKLMHLKDWDFAKTGLPFKIQWLDVPEKVTQIMANLCPNLASEAFVCTYGRFVVEFIAPVVSKGNAISLVAIEEGLDRSQILAFGDEKNDISMLNWAGLGVAMSHAGPEVQAAANLVAPPGDPASALARAIDLVFQLN